MVTVTVMVIKNKMKKTLILITGLYLTGCRIPDELREIPQQTREVLFGDYYSPHTKPYRVKSENSRGEAHESVSNTSAWRDKYADTNIEIKQYGKTNTD